MKSNHVNPVLPFRGETFYQHKRPNQPLGAQIQYPVKASGDLKMENCYEMPYISGS